MLKDRFVALVVLAQSLGTYWFITTLVCAIPLATLVWQRRRGRSLTPVPKRALYILTVPLAASLLIGIAATDLDLRFEWVGPASFWVFGTFLLVSLAGIGIITVRFRSQRLLLLATVPLQSWLALCANWASFVAVSGFGRHWR